VRRKQRRGDATQRDQRSIPTQAPLAGALRRGIKGVIARWAVATCSGERPTPQDEALHGLSGDVEGYTFALVQPDAALVARLEWLPHRERRRVSMVVLLGEQAYAPSSAGIVVVTGRHLPAWSAGGLELDCVDPLHVWTVRFSGQLEHVPGDVVDGAVGVSQCVLDMTFDASAPAFVPGIDDDDELRARHLGDATWDAQLVRALRNGFGRGYVQVGDGHGSMLLGDRAVPIRGAVIREHGWGMLDWHACKWGYRCLVSLEDDTVGWVHHTDFPWLTLEGGFSNEKPRGVQPLRGIGLTQERSPTGLPVRISLTLERSDRLLQLHGEVRSVFPMELDGRATLRVALMRLTGEVKGWAVWVEGP